MSGQGSVIAAHVRLALVRGRRSFLVATSVVVAATLAAAVLPLATAWVVVVVGVFVCLATALVAPITVLGSEKMLGSLELDRTLPVPLRTIATGRLLGAAVRTLPIPLLLLALGMATVRSAPDLHAGTLAASFALAMLAYWSLLWLGYGMISRFPARILVWAPGIVWLALVVMPSTVETAIESRVELLVDRVFRQGDPSAALLVGIVAGALAVAALVFALASAILVSGLARYRHDPAALAGPVGAVPKKELAAFGRGPALAVARLRLRLATEQFRREMMIVGALVVVIILDWGGLADFARVYLPIVAALIPAMVAVQLIAARATGSLEALQQLPHPRRQVAVGHLLAVMVLALPAAVIHAVSRATEGAEPALGALFVRFAIYVLAGYAASALVVWGTVRRMLILLAIVVVAPLALMLATGVLLASSGFTPGASALAMLGRLGGAGPLIPLALVLVGIGIANELFSFGLATFQGNAPRK